MDTDSVVFSVEYDYNIFDIMDTVSESLSVFGLEIVNVNVDDDSEVESFEIRKLEN